MFKLHIAVFLFGLSSIFARLINLPSASLVLSRAVIAAITLLVILKLINKSKLPSKNAFFKTLPSGILLALHWWSFFYSIQVSSIAIGLLSFSTFPIFVAILQPLINRIKINPVDIISALLVTSGLVLIVPEYTLTSNTTVGVLWGLLSGITFALLTIWNKKVVGKIDSINLAMLQNFWASLCLIYFYKPIFLISSNEVVFLLILGTLCTAISHWMFVESLKNVRAELASITAGLEPIYGIILGVFLFSEIPNYREIIGGIIILSTVFYSQITATRLQKL